MGEVNPRRAARFLMPQNLTRKEAMQWLRSMKVVLFLEDVEAIRFALTDMAYIEFIQKEVSLLQQSISDLRIEAKCLTYRLKAPIK